MQHRLELPEDLRKSLEGYFHLDLQLLSLFLEKAVPETMPAVAMGDTVLIHPKYYCPESPGGVFLLAHELSHLWQQASAFTGGGFIQEMDANARALDFIIRYFSGEEFHYKGTLLQPASESMKLQGWGLGGVFSLKQILADRLAKKEGFFYFYQGPHEYLTEAASSGVSTLTREQKNSLILGAQMNDMYLLPHKISKLMNKKDLDARLKELLERANKESVFIKRFLSGGDGTNRADLSNSERQLIDISAMKCSQEKGANYLICIALNLLELYIVLPSNYEIVKKRLKDIVKPFKSMKDDFLKEHKSRLIRWIISCSGDILDRNLIDVLLEGYEPFFGMILELEEYILDQEKKTLHSQPVSEILKSMIDDAEVWWEGESASIRNLEAKVCRFICDTVDELRTWKEKLQKYKISEGLKKELSLILQSFLEFFEGLKSLYESVLFLCCSHTGEMQFLHSMDCSDGNLEKNKNKMIRWAVFCREIYQSGAKPGTALLGEKIYPYLCSCGDSLLQEMLLPLCCIYTELGNCRLRAKKNNTSLTQEIRKSLDSRVEYRSPFADKSFREFFNGGLAGIDPRYTALGMAMHMIEDSFTPSHTIRAWNIDKEEGSAPILYFADYKKQDSLRHAHADYFVDTGLFVDERVRSEKDQMALSSDSKKEKKSKEAISKERTRESAIITVGAVCAEFYAKKYFEEVTSKTYSSDIRITLGKIYHIFPYKRVLPTASGRCYEMEKLTKISKFSGMEGTINNANLKKYLAGKIGPMGVEMEKSIQDYREYLLLHFAANRYPRKEDLKYYSMRNKKKEMCQSSILGCLGYGINEEADVFLKTLEQTIKAVKDIVECDHTAIALKMFLLNDIPFLLEILLNDSINKASLDALKGESNTENVEIIEAIRKRYVTHLNELSLIAQAVIWQESQRKKAQKERKIIMFLSKKVIDQCDAIIWGLNSYWRLDGKEKFELPKQTENSL